MRRKYDQKQRKRQSEKRVNQGKPDECPRYFGFNNKNHNLIIFPMLFYNVFQVKSSTRIQQSDNLIE